MSASTATTIILFAVFMGVLLFAAVFIGLHFSKKSAQKFQQKREMDKEK